MTKSKDPKNSRGRSRASKRTVLTVAKKANQPVTSSVPEMVTTQDLERLRRQLNFAWDGVIELTHEFKEARAMLDSLGIPRLDNKLNVEEPEGKFKTEVKSINLYHGTATAIRYARCDLSEWEFPDDHLLSPRLTPYVRNGARWFIEHCMGWSEDHGPRCIELEWIRWPSRQDGLPMPEDPLTFDVTFFDGRHYCLALRYRLWDQWESQLEEASGNDIHKDDAARCLADFEALQRRLREVADLLEPHLAKIRNRLGGAQK